MKQSVKDKLKRTVPYLGIVGTVLAPIPMLRGLYVEKVDNRFKDQDDRFERFKAEFRQEVKLDIQFQFNQM
jgi:hypothetical protein